MEELNKQLIEDTTGPAADNIATTDQNLSVDQMFQQAGSASLAKKICSIVPVSVPTAGIFNLKKKDGTNNLELVRENVNIFPSKIIETGISQESIQDIKIQYGKEAEKVIGTLLRGLANEDENTKLLSYLDTNAKLEPVINLTESTNSEYVLFELNKKIHELILRANNKDIRTYGAFVVVPATSLSAIMALSEYAGGEDKDESGVFIAQIGQTKYYLNPDPTSSTCYVGLKDNSNFSKSSLVFSPYQSQVIETIDPTSGDMKYFIVNRFGITKSPLHVTGNEMLFKFTINETP